MKKISVLFLLVAGSLVAAAQSSATNVEFNKALRPALSLPLQVTTETAEQTILAKLKETGYKPEKSSRLFNKKNKEDGFYKFSGVVLPELTNQRVDLYFKVEAVNNNSSDRSSITLLVSKGYENFISSQNDSATFMASEKFLNGFVNSTNVYNINHQLDEQNENLANSEKKWTNLRDKQADAKKKIAQLESDIKTWHEEEVLQQQDVEKLRSVVRDLEAQRTSAHK
jgi:hypothetical protein